MMRSTIIMDNRRKNPPMTRWHTTEQEAMKRFQIPMEEMAAVSIPTMRITPIIPLKCSGTRS